MPLEPVPLSSPSILPWLRRRACLGHSCSLPAKFGALRNQVEMDRQPSRAGELSPEPRSVRLPLELDRRDDHTDARGIPHHQRIGASHGLRMTTYWEAND